MAMLDRKLPTDSDEFYIQYTDESLEIRGRRGYPIVSAKSISKNPQTNLKVKGR